MRRDVVLVPRRADGGRRDRLWEHVAPTLADWPIVEGHHDDGPFNRSAAINCAAADAGDWDVVAIVDADTLTPASQVAAAFDLAAESDALTFGFTRYVALTREGTDQLLDGHDIDRNAHVEWEEQNTASSCVVVSRRLWDLVGGFDEGFEGWGWEDVAFSLAAQALGDGWRRVEGSTWHLWHEPAVGAGDVDSPIWKVNKRHADPYLEAAGDRSAMEALIGARQPW